MIILILVLAGLCLGSFSNALVWRLHEQQKGKKSAAERRKLSIVSGHSMCTKCHHQLGLTDLIPVVSWLWLRGRCRYCHQPISWQYPAVELITAGLFVGSYVYWPHGWSAVGISQFVVWLGVLVLFMALTVYDLRWMLLPNRLVYPLTGLALAEVLMLALWQGNVSIVVGALWGVLCLAGLFYALFTVSNGTWIGGGDVRLGVSLGLLVSGPVKALLVLLLASLIGTVFTLPLLLTGKKHLSQKVPFGPFLILATIIVYLFGASLITWYRQRFLLI